MATGSLITTKGKNLFIYRAYTENADLSATQYLAPSKLKIGVDNSTPNIADTDLDFPIPIANGILNDDGSNTFTGSSGGDNSTANTDTYKDGAGVTDNTAQNLIANDSATTKIWTIANLASSGTVITATKYGALFLYIVDAAALAKIVSVEVKLGEDTSNYYSITVLNAALSVGWNWIADTSIGLINTWTETGTITGTIDYFIIEIVTNNATDAFVAGDIVYDTLRTWDYADTISAFSVGYPSFDYVNNEASIRGYINSLQGNGFLINSVAIVNEDTSPLVQGEDTFTGESKSNTDEFVFVIKDRVI